MLGLTECSVRINRGGENRQRVTVTVSYPFSDAAVVGHEEAMVTVTAQDSAAPASQQRLPLSAVVQDGEVSPNLVDRVLEVLGIDPHSQDSLDKLECHQDYAEVVSRLYWLLCPPAR